MKKKRAELKRRKRRTKRNTPLEAATQLHQSGELLEAEQAYRRLLVANPGDGQLLYLCGVVAEQLGKAEEAIRSLQLAVLSQPEHLPAISLLAKLYQENGQLQASANALRTLISFRPELGELYCNLGIVLLRLGELDEATKVCRQAVALNPTLSEAHSNLGDVFKKTRSFDQAAAAYRQAILLKPESPEVYRELVAVLRNDNKYEEAAEVIKQWLICDPENPVAQHMLAAYGGEGPPTRASDDYVRCVFDEFANTFDDDLMGLDYQGPRLIAEAVVAELNEKATGLVVLDAGCGTGLCGPLLRPFAGELKGVDLSAGMIQRAQQLNLYDDLVEAELTNYLNDHPSEFDLIVAADTFIYFGELNPLLKAAFDALQEGGVLVFTLEQSAAAAADCDYRLNPSGRYSHNLNYVERSLRACGLTISAMETSILRRERDQPVTGIIIRARRYQQSN